MTSRYFNLFGTEAPVALVTGAGAPRIGRTIANTLARHGYQVAVHANTAIDAALELAKELTSEDRKSIAVQADIREEPQIATMVETVYEEYERIDVLVNSAAIWEPKRFEEVSTEDVRRHFEINTLGTFLCSQYVGQIMIGQARGGAIVNIGDWATVRPYEDYSAYFPSKGAIPAMTRSLAVELGGRNPGIRVNAVLPGPVMLPPDMPAEQRRAAIEATLVKREGSPQNVADAALMMIENDFITGTCLPVDGGRTVYAP